MSSSFTNDVTSHCGGKELGADVDGPSEFERLRLGGVASIVANLMLMQVSIMYKKWL